MTSISRLLGLSSKAIDFKRAGPLDFSNDINISSPVLSEIPNKPLVDFSSDYNPFLNSKKNLGKQLNYANKRACPVAIISGENEFKDNKITLKNLLGIKGENNQVTFSKENLINEIKKFI